MDMKEYLETRVDGQIEWYDHKAHQARTWYKRLQIMEIVLAALIPLLSGYTTSSAAVAFIVGLFGAVIAVTQSISKLNKYHENWIQYRATCEMLRYQKTLYVTGSSPYNTKDETIQNVFVKNVENIISSENNQWKDLNNSRQENGQEES